MHARPFAVPTRTAICPGECPPTLTSSTCLLSFKRPSIGKATPDNGLVERGISRRTISPGCDVRRSTVGERLHHLSQSFSVVSGLSCGDGRDVRNIPSQFTFAKKDL